jgi:Flp pilus assembly protein TadD
LIKESIINLDKYLLLNKNDAGKWVIKAQLHIQLGQIEEALNAVDKGIQINPSIGEYYFTRAIILDQMGKVNEAKNEIRKSRQYGYDGQAAKREEILNK